MANKKKKTVKKPAKASKAKKNEPAKDPSKPLPRKEKYQRQLRVELTDEEVAAAALDAAEKLALRDSKADQLKATNEHAKAEIKDLEAELRRLSGVVRERATKRPVVCETTWDHETKTVTDRRTDTNELLSSREMTEAELQVELPFRDIDDDFDDAAEPGEGIGEDAEHANKPPKSGAKAKKPKPDAPKESESKPTDEPPDLGETEKPSDADEKPDAAE